MHRLSYLLLTTYYLLPTFLPAQTDTTTLDASIVVTASRGLNDNVPEARIAAAIGRLNARSLAQAGNLTPLTAFNQLPGVRFEERAPGSYRLSIRGSTLRSPFGVRNVKVYWNGIPFTQPGGDTPLNFLDNAQYGNVEVIRGPASSVYGAGTAGAVLISDASPSEARYHLTQTAGSYGTSRSEVGLQFGQPRSNLRVRLADQRSDGYRDHSRFERQTVQLSHRQRLNGAAPQQLEFHLLYTRLGYDLPGALTAEQYADNPRQARPGSAETNASINYDNLLLGTNYSWKNKNWTVSANAYATGFYFDHPFNFDYKRETNLGTGGRLVIDRRVNNFTFSLGTEQQLQLRMANNFENENQRPGALNFSDEVTTTEGLYFGRASLELPSGWRFTAGASLNDLTYRVDRTFDANGNTGQFDSGIPGILRPRLSIARQVGNNWVYGAISTGFSPPTLTEFRTNEGSINTGLAPERGTNYEIGLKHRPLDGDTEFTLSLYALRLTETITSFADDRGTRLFRNAGRTDQRGVEVSFRRSLRQNRYGISLLDLNVSYAYSDYRYEDGETLPGTAPHVANLWLNYDSRERLFGTLSYNFTDRIPLNDGNDVFADGYHLVRTKVGYHLNADGRFPVDVFAGGNNLLDQTLTLGSDLNPQFGGRYFQPAAGRTWFVGVRVSR